MYSLRSFMILQTVLSFCICSLYSPSKSAVLLYPLNCPLSPKLNLLRNRSAVSMLEHVFMIFFILFSAIILSRGISGFAAALSTHPWWKRKWLIWRHHHIVASLALARSHNIPSGHALSHIITHYRLIVNKFGAQKHNALINSIVRSPKKS